ncbi:TPA: chemotaxis protein [Klebsiella pneumoniae]|uniref:chemotaxis protein n=1 Tax=Klebsiella variicola TaxID=244366 RepID=UPI0024A7507A|nr:chemotaxis protein [Klebsiella variicola]HBZ0628904.1 chemotaxis protein [Klebsiella pneumoniae]WHE63571.1 chemotaxis protein [Klebsiella variicola]HBW0854202.1 chemotaxis protein [Klebsiella variicola]HBW0859309.1 chemotaxis protein [Klebsiella variicola]HBW0865204.1 chemotaxis protein [Klebsiella variicola]
MSATNYTVSSLVNKVSWEVDETSYQKALKRIKRLKEENEAPQKKLEQAKKRATQSEGKAALAAAKAQTKRLALAQRLSAEQQKQALTAAKQAQQEQAHAKKMAALSAKNAAQAMSQDEALARQNLRLSRISEKVRAASRSRAMAYNPDMGGRFADPAVVGRQNASMNRGHAAISADIAATKAALAAEEKREAALRREVNYYNGLRRSALTLANVNGADVATRYKAISAAKEALKAQKEERYTVEETRFEMARITGELRRQARLQNRITKEQKAAGRRAGRVNREKASGGNPALIAGGVIGAATFAGSMGVARVENTLSGSLERSRDLKKLQQYNISALEFAALQDLAMNKAGISLTADSLADKNKDTKEKAGELLNTGSFKRNAKTGAVTFSGGGEFADIVNLTLQSTNGNQKVAQTVINELQKGNFVDFIIYLKQLQKTFKWTDNQVRHLAEAVNDGSQFLNVFSDQGDNIVDRMRKLSNEGWTLSAAQQENLDKLNALSVEYNRVQEGLSSHFSSGFVAGLGQYATNTDNLSASMAKLIPITDDLGRFAGETVQHLLDAINWLNSINPENKHEQLNDSGWYYDDSAVGWLVNRVKAAAGTFTGASTIPGVQGTPSQTFGSGTAMQRAALPTIGPAMTYQPMIPTFTPPSLDAIGSRPPIPVSVTGQPIDLNNKVDIFVHDEKVTGLIDARVRDSERAQVNLLAGVMQ